MKFIKMTLLSVIVLTSSGCEKNNSCISTEIYRVTSPDKILDAVTVKTNCGATTSYSYRVFIVPVGKNPENKSVLLVDKTEDLNIFWQTSKNLAITYTKARIFEYTNFWQSKDVDNFKYLVSITESRRKK